MCLHEKLRPLVPIQGDIKATIWNMEPDISLPIPRVKANIIVPGAKLCLRHISVIWPDVQELQYTYLAIFTPNNLKSILKA